MWTSIDAVLINAIKLTLLLAAVVFFKQWWQRQKEKEKLEREKITAELQLLKAQIHPAFLFSTLNNIISHAEAASPKAPEMLIKLSDLLSYMLYECDVSNVKLEKEIGMIREYMELEKIRQGGKLEMTFQVNGILNGKRIAPLLLLPFIDNAFSYSNNVEQAWINLTMSVDENTLSMKLINGLPAIDRSAMEVNEQSLANVKKRLQLLYPGNYELKINADHELLMVYLIIKLEEEKLEEPTTSEIPEFAWNYAGV